MKKYRVNFVAEKLFLAKDISDIYSIVDKFTEQFSDHIQLIMTHVDNVFGVLEEIEELEDGT
tara:strand:+ start:599 stop:784 length:186 start_codon:yes stop_codon:yes gene_type:complete